ncbi:UNVERIFIED_CONTAM: Retrovirus-related Pol polyprotein from transposon RE1 [Sesamum latifolium]|uniref:Retrovirus-related Pol polyprotein from transposon RE1 n=1 Tax=Sesamum latifolium TaxID=2727402 RepID=A0AAW2Y9M9_9LAMI
MDTMEIAEDICFSLVAKVVTVRLFLAISSAFSWPLHQLDVNNAFLHGYLDEEIYMTPPKGYSVQPGQGTGDSFIALLVYVDDVLLTSPSSVLINEVKYINDILQDTGLLNAKAATTPLPQGVKLCATGGAVLSNPESYRRLVGRLLYLGFTRPDISYGVQQLSQFLQQPCESHWQAALHIVRYLKGTSATGLFFPSSNSFQLQAYCNADWASCVDSRRSVTGFSIFLGTALISWKTKKQATVSRSSAEAEYRSMGATVCELQWVTYLLHDFGIPVITPIPLFCDNQAAIHITANPVCHERTKHLDIDCHIVRDQYKLGFINPTFVRSKEQIADVFTNSLPRPLFLHLLSKLSLFTLTTGPALGGCVGNGNVDNSQHHIDNG